MNLLLSCTKNQLIRCLEVIWSVKMNTKNQIESWILVDDDVHVPKDLARFGITVHLVKIDQFNLDKSPLMKDTIKNFPLMVYGRLFVEKFLPDNVDRILYLDTDICVYNDIDSLYSVNIDGFYCAACRDISIELFAKHELVKRNVNKYFNSGVLLMNISQMRADKIGDELLKIYFNPPLDFVEDAWWHDQSILNLCFRENVKFLDPKWNIQSILFGYRQYDEYIKSYGYTSLKDLFKRGSISHAQGGAKPWNFEMFLNWQSYQLPYRVWQFNVWNNVKKSLVKNVGGIEDLYINEKVNQYGK